MLDPGRTATSAHIMNLSDQNLINQPLPAGRLSCDSTYDIREYGNRVRESAEHYSKFRQSWSGPVVVDAAVDADGDGDGDEEGGGEFGFSTPPMWGHTSPSARPLLLPQRMNDNKNHYRNLSPASKTQAIARGQRELMEMVSKMPESCYELSLRDLVEQQQPVVEEKGKQEQESEKEVMKKKRNDKKMEIVNKKKNGGSASSSNNNAGFLLKMVFPLPFGVKNNNKKKKKKKKKSELGPYSFKVAPRPPVMEGSDRAVDKEWWKKRFEQSESESYGSSSHNGSVKSSLGSSNSSSSLGSRNSTTRHKTGGCFPFSFFFRKHKSKNVH